jgi:UDP:flavonoid glycosyltransferase YjiC (YdhE family)
MRTIAKLLIASGYEVTFVSGSPYQKMMEEVGCTYVPLEGYGDWTEADIESRWPERKLLLPGPQQLSFDIEECFMKSIPSQFEASQKAMKMLREKSPGRKIV